MVGLGLGLLLWAAVMIYALPSDDDPGQPDVVVVLGGAGGERAELGIELAERFDVPLVLSSSAAYFGAQQGRVCGEDAICFDPVPENTAGEAENVSRMADQRGWDEVLVATSAFHTSRSRFLFEQCLGDERVNVVGATRAGQPATTPRLLARESLGILAGATFARAC
ncbi:MAG: YdcF family protein [Nitriliruptoraceae bacterium]